MVGYIYVSETPFFAKTEAAGTATIDDKPRASTPFASAPEHGAR